MYSKTSNSPRGAAALFGLSLLTLFHTDALASTVGDWVDISSLVTTEQGSTFYNRTSREYQSTVAVTNDSGDELTGPVRLVIATANILTYHRSTCSLA